MKISIHTENLPNVHTCTSELKGDWFVFRCPHCPDYRRKFNFRTGELITKPGADIHALHQAQFSAPSLTPMEDFMN